MLVPESGGEPVALTELEPGETPNVTPSHRWPEFLPDGKTVLFTKTPNDNDYEIADIVAGKEPAQFRGMVHELSEEFPLPA